MRSRKNVTASIRQRLLNIAMAEKLEFQLILTRYALERFLFRLSQSKHANDLILKGAMLFQVWGGSLYRPTRDLDLLSYRELDSIYFTKVLADICNQKFSDDGVVLHGNSLQLENIKEEDEYQGLRATLLATLDTARIPLQIDIGFGDSIVPAPISIDFPTLLDLPSPKLKAYSKETVVAEKFHAMVHHGIANSRMKDFYDLWVLATTSQFDSVTLDKSIRSTFKRRATILPELPPLALTDEFANDAMKLTQWSAFLKKSKLLDPQVLDLNQIVKVIAQLIVPLITVGNRFRQKRRWDPKNLRWIENPKGT